MLRKSLLSLLLVTALLTVLATPLFAALKMQKTEPENGAKETRPVRALRVWFDAAPNVEKSKIELTGPAGKLEVTGLHSMGDNDLMARVVGNMPDGEYHAKWTAAGDDGEMVEGEFSFTVERAAAKP